MRIDIRGSRPSFASSVALVGTLMFLFFPGQAAAQAAKKEDQEQRQLKTIKAQLSYRFDRDKTWYVLQFEIINVRSTFSPNGSRHVVKSSVGLRKVQGQDQAAQIVLDFLKETSPEGTRRYFVHSFSDTKDVEQRMERHIAGLMASARALGYTPELRPR